MSKPMPLAELLRTYGRLANRGPDRPTARAQPNVVAQLASQLGLLPTLQFLQDGLERSSRCLNKYGDQLDACLRIVPGPTLDARTLIKEIQALLAWVELQQWAPDDPRLHPMGRDAGKRRHPLSGYALSVCHHWSNLFYTLDPVANAANDQDRGVAQRVYEDLMAEFSMYVLAAQATIETNDYLRYCADWWSTGVQPERTLYPDGRLASRVADASRAVRRLSRPEYQDPFSALCRSDGRPSLAERAMSTTRQAWSDVEQGEVDAIYRLLEDVVPGWSTEEPAGRRARGHARSTSPSKTIRRRYRDGYVRISESPCISTSTDTDVGVRFEATVRRPQQPDDLAAELAGSVGVGALAASGLIFPTGDVGADTDALARARLDGQQWIPTDEKVADGGIECALISDAASGYAATPGIHPGTSSRWAADHRRRMLMAHRLAPTHLRAADIHRVLTAMGGEDVAPENAPAIACLHAAIALGRPLEQATSLEIHESLRDKYASDQIHYALQDRQWVLFAPPPAWEDMQVTRCERWHWSRIQLRDRTGFSELLARLDLARPGRPVKRLSSARLGALRSWIERVLPAADTPLTACPAFLFDRLLEVSNGDLGLARLITGRALAHSESVAHYVHYDAAVLWDAYWKCWASPQADGGNRTVLGGGVHMSEADTRHGFGARRVPTVSSVRSLLGWLRQQVKLATDADRHNYYTAYTWAGLVLGTGLRPVTDPYIYPIGTGVAAQPMVTFVDKARSDYHRRIDVVPTAVRTHLDRYTHHLRDLDRVPDAPGTTRVLAFRYCSRETGQYRTFRPSDFEDLCRAEFDLELYALRRFVRTELVSDPEVTRAAKLPRDIQITPEDVDAFMGHWFDGVSPHDPLSTYPTMRLQAVAHAVSALLRKVSFKPYWIDQGRC